MPLRNFIDCVWKSLTPIPKFLFFVGALTSASCRPSAERVEEPQSSILTLTPSRVNFGNIPQGKASVQAVMAENSTSRPIAITRWQSSCDCVSLSPESMHLDVGERRYFTVTCDNSHDPDYLGVLGVEVVGYTEGGESVRFVVDVAVVPAAAL